MKFEIYVCATVLDDHMLVGVAEDFRTIYWITQDENNRLHGTEQNTNLTKEGWQRSVDAGQYKLLRDLL